jgi:hypothetical protein
MAGMNGFGRAQIHKPTAYDRFDNDKRNSWLDDLQARIEQTINPPVEAGPSRTPSPFKPDQIEEFEEEQVAEDGDDDLEYADVFGGVAHQAELDEAMIETYPDDEAVQGAGAEIAGREMGGEVLAPRIYPDIPSGSAAVRVLCQVYAERSEAEQIASCEWVHGRPHVCAGQLRL